MICGGLPWFIARTVCFCSLAFILGGIFLFATSALYDLGNERYSAGFGLSGCALIFLGFVGVAISGVLL